MVGHDGVIDQLCFLVERQRHAQDDVDARLQGDEPLVQTCGAPANEIVLRGRHRAEAPKQALGRGADRTGRRITFQTFVGPRRRAQIRIHVVRVVRAQGQRETHVIGRDPVERIRGGARPRSPGGRCLTLAGGEQEARQQGPEAKRPATCHDGCPHQSSGSANA